MPRVSREPNLASKAARARLRPRREPYFRSIEHHGADGSLGLRLGYRRTPLGGHWIAQAYDPDTRTRTHYSLGAADDGAAGRTYAEAQAAAREWLKGLRRARAAGYEYSGPYTVANALDDYLTHYERRGGKAKIATKSAIESLIKPALGDLEVAKLTKRRLEDWHRTLAEAPARLRSKRGAAAPRTRAKSEDPESVRRRRATANRVLTVLKAALNHAHREGRAATDDAWRQVRPFRDVDAAVVRYLSAAECKRLVNACDVEFRPMVRAALLTGCRFGELARLTVADFNPDAGTVAVRASKGGKPRHVILTAEGREFFEEATTGKVGAARIFTRDGEPWGKSHQARPMLEACQRANISPAASFHVLRHTHGSLLAMQGVPLNVIARQLGHADTRMTEKHYAHLAPNYVTDTIRAAFPKLDIIEPRKVARIG